MPDPHKSLNPGTKLTVAVAGLACGALAFGEVWQCFNLGLWGSLAAGVAGLAIGVLAFRPVFDASDRKRYEISTIVYGGLRHYLAQERLAVMTAPAGELVERRELLEKIWQEVERLEREPLPGKASAKRQTDQKKGAKKSGNASAKRQTDQKKGTKK
jgi:hypothetical protein